MPLCHRMTMAILTSCVLATPAFAGYEYPLQSPEVRNAFFLGQRNNWQTIEFLEAYTKRWTQPQSDKYTISEVDVLTPYLQIVQRGIRLAPADSEVQTETDLRAHPLRFLVKASVYFNAASVDTTPSGIETQDSGHTFSAELSQAHEIAPLRTAVDPIYGKHGPSGVLITLEVDPDKITSAPLHITVRTPDGRSVSADFDLSKLK